MEDRLCRPKSQNAGEGSRIDEGGINDQDRNAGSGDENETGEDDV